jgi:multidrug efflux pump subunit AcrB
MMLSLNAKDLSPAVLRTLGDDKVSPLLERVKGVASVSVDGGLKRRINVRLDPVLLASHNLSPSAVTAAIQGSAGTRFRRQHQDRRQGVQTFASTANTVQSIRYAT